MKYLIVSDIHGSLPALEQVLAFYREQQCGMLCILGDILNYGPRNGIPQGLDPKGIAERLNAMAGEIVAIRGNCDSEVDQMLLDFPILSDYTLLVDNGKRFFLTHGHIYNEDRLPKGRFDCLFMVTPTGGNLNGKSIQWSAIPAPSLSRRMGTCLHSLFTVTVRYPFIGWTAAGSRNFLSDGECIITAYYNCSLL